MIDRKQLLADLKPLLRDLETDLRARCDEVSEIDQRLQAEYEQARSAGRIGIAYEQWRADLITQVGVAWILSCVFVRFLEDNGLLASPKISGRLREHPPAGGLERARDERDLYFQDHSTDSDRDYLLHVFKQLAALPATAELFGPHNPLNEHPDWLSGDAAQKLIEFFQRIDTDGTGEIVHDFTDDAWDTRFLGDLYQDLSEAARKKYALLQTPVFVEEFILDRTLEPAINEFGLRGFKMIDPACGSGHFLLGAFARILDHWRHVEPGAGERELINRALASVHGVDINPYAVAIARFRLLLAAMKESGITHLKDAPSFQLNLACGDSLLHGSANGQQQVLGFHELAHHYQSEDIDALKRILKPRQYHAVVANPPYVAVKDRALNQAYRDRYESAYSKYALTAPFLERLFELTLDGGSSTESAGYLGTIIGNSFMRQQFGQKLVEDCLPVWDLTHVIDTAGAYLPGHGTPTVILFARNREPVSATVRVVMGIRGEPATPSDPAKGVVWSAILDQVDRPGSETEFVSVADIARERFHTHPWSIGGGGAADLKELIDEAGCQALSDCALSIGIVCFTLSDEIYCIPWKAGLRSRVPREYLRGMITGEDIRNWHLAEYEAVVFPYRSDFSPISCDRQAACLRYLWRARTCLANSRMFGRQTKVEAGLRWYEYGRLTYHKLETPNSIIFANVVTHNHFHLDDGGKIYNSHAPLIKLPADATMDDHHGLVGLLNSALACFWIKQICHNKGSTVDEHGARQRTVPFEDFFEVTGTALGAFPIPGSRPVELGRELATLGAELERSLPRAAAHTAPRYGDLQADTVESVLGRMVALQEELDWECYELYGLLNNAPRCDDPPLIHLGQRAFEIVLARKMETQEDESSWFIRHNSTPITEIPPDWPEEYKQVIQRRIELIESDRNIGLIERPEYKRRWNIEPWEQQREKALRSWLLDRLEGYFDLDGRMNDEGKITAHASLRQPRLTSIAQAVDIARADGDFMQVAEHYRGRADFDIGTLVAELIDAESVPHLPVLRYKPSGLDKRVAWERTWDLQRLEDAVDGLFDVDRLKKIEPDKPQESLCPLVAALRIEEQSRAEVLREAVNAGNRHVKGTHVGAELGPTYGILYTLTSRRQRGHDFADLLFFTDSRKR